MERGRIIRSKKKPPGGFLEARTAIRCKHLASWRPPAAKQRKIGKAGSARSHPGLRESLQRPPGGKDVCHCGAHDLTIPYRKLPVNDLVHCTVKMPISSTVAHQSRPSIIIRVRRMSRSGLPVAEVALTARWDTALIQSAVTTADHFFGFPLAKLTSSAWGRRHPFCPHWPRIC